MASNGTASAKLSPPSAHVEEALYTLIASLRPGDRLPPEPALARQLGVSRATLREVMRTFVERGVLVRRRGVGTFVASRFPILEAGLEVLESLDRMSRRLGLQTEVAYLEVMERPATPTEAAGLRYAADDETPVLVVNRVIAIAGEPVADLRDVVPVTYLRASDLGTGFRGSVLDLLLERGSPVLSVSRTEIAAVSAEPKFADRLHIPLGSPLLKFVAQLFTFDEKVVDLSVSYFVPGHFRFHVMRRVLT